MRALLGFIVYGSTLLILCIGGAGFWAMQEFDRPSLITQQTQPYLFEIMRGDTAGLVAGRLHDEGIIAHPYIFTYGSRIVGLANQIKAGEYQIQPNMSARELLELFASGKTYQRLFTIREGLTSYEVMRELSEVKDLVQLPAPLPAEGSLLPESYSFARGDSNLDALARMDRAMKAAIDTLWESRAADLPLASKEEAVILASIVEKETGVGGERAKIAGVFINRLRIGMRLQTDPTVIYALTMGEHENAGKGPLGRRLLRKDLSFDSPYNTYLYAGLPPTPIANPGYEAIKATLNPEVHDYLYFVAAPDGAGRHAFSKTLNEHNASAAKWRAHRKATGK